MPEIPSIPAAYRLSVIASEDIDKARGVVEIDGALSDSEWNWYRNGVVPDGVFVVQERASSALVGVISAHHNPAATRFYFPGGGQLGYLVVAPEHRQRGLGAALIAAAVRRLHQGRLSPLLPRSTELTASCNPSLPARRLPTLHPPPELLPRWRSVFAALSQEVREDEWPTRLTAPHL